MVNQGLFLANSTSVYHKLKNTTIISLYLYNLRRLARIVPAHLFRA
jgi:hypothetical protein